MLRLYFENDLVELTHDLETIWACVLGQYKVILDFPTEQQLQEVIENDHLINEAVMKLDEKCLAIICLQHPVTGDLRRIVTIMKLSTDIERIGDRLVGIARVLQSHHITDEWQDIFDEIKVLQMAVRDQIKKALVYYRNIQTEEAEVDFDPRRKEITGYYHSLEKKVMGILAKDAGNVETGLNGLDILQNLDKISNLVLSIYKWMAYQKTGTISMGEDK